MFLKNIALSTALITYLLFAGGCYVPASTPVTGKTYNALLSGTNEVPPNNSSGSGSVKFVLSQDQKTASVTITLGTLEGNLKYSYVLGPAKTNENTTEVVFPMNGKLTGVTPLTENQLIALKAGLLYVNIYSDKYPGGEIRGQLK